jgi:hypothetical protein
MAKVSLWAAVNQCVATVDIGDTEGNVYDAHPVILWRGRAFTPPPSIWSLSPEALADPGVPYGEVAVLEIPC